MVDEYDHEYVAYLSLEENLRDLLIQFQSLGDGYHRIGTANGFKGATQRVRSLHHRGYIEKRQGERHTKWAISDKATRCLEKARDEECT